MANAADEGLDREYFDLTTATSEEASAAIFRAMTPPSGGLLCSSAAGMAGLAGGGVGGETGDGSPIGGPLAAFDIVNLGDDEFGFRLPDNTVVDSTGNQTRHKG